MTVTNALEKGLITITDLDRWNIQYYKEEYDGELELDENGDIVFLDLQKVSPFCDVDIMSLFGTNISYIKTLINGLHRPVL